MRNCGRLTVWRRSAYQSKTDTQLPRWRWLLMPGSVEKHRSPFLGEIFFQLRPARCTNDSSAQSWLNHYFANRARIGLAPTFSTLGNGQGSSPEADRIGSPIGRGDRNGVFCRTGRLDGGDARVCDE